MKLIKIAYRNINRNKKRSLLSIIGTAIATGAIVFLFAYLEGIYDDMHHTAFNYVTGEIIIRNVDFDDKVFSLDRAVDDYAFYLEKLKLEFPEAEYSPRIEFPSTLLDGDRSHLLFGLGVNFKLEESYLNLEEKIIHGTIPTSSREVLMGKGLSEELGLKVGDKFTPITTTRLGASSGITFRVSGIAEFRNPKFNNKTFLASLEELPEMLRMNGAVSNILIKGIGEEKQKPTIDRINKIITDFENNSIKAYSWREVGLVYSMMEMAGGVYDIVAVFFFLLSSSVIANTMLMVVFERRKEIGMITAMGMTSVEVIRLFFLEALLLGLLGAGFGVLIGIGFVVPLSYIGIDLTSASEGVDMGISFLIFPKVTIRSTLVVFFYSVFIASFVSFFPSRSAAKVDPVVALRSL